MTPHSEDKPVSVTELVHVLGEALASLEAFYERPDENHFDRFERVGDWFKNETGYLRPGKDSVLHDPEIRQAAWDKWTDEKIEKSRAALTQYNAFKSVNTGRAG